MLQYSRTQETADAVANVATELVELLAKINKVLLFNTYQNISYTPATKVATIAFASDIWTSAAHGLLVGQKVRLTNSGGALPAGFLPNKDYFIITSNFAANTFMLSVALGGATVDGTDNGTGTHTVNPVPDYIVEETNGTGNMLGRAFDRVQVSNAVGTLNLVRRILLNQDVTGLMTLAAPGDNLGNLNALAKAQG